MQLEHHKFPWMTLGGIILTSVLLPVAGWTIKTTADSREEISSIKTELKVQQPHVEKRLERIEDKIDLLLERKK